MRDKSQVVELAVYPAKRLGFLDESINVWLFEYP